MFIINKDLKEQLISLSYETEKYPWRIFNTHYNEKYTNENISFGRRILDLNSWENFDLVLRESNRFLDGVDKNKIHETHHYSAPIPHFLAVLYKDKSNRGITLHTDCRTHHGWFQFRANFMLAAPTKGGENVTGGKLTVLHEDESCGIWASETAHRALPVLSDDYRITLNFGYFVQPDYAQEFQEIVDKKLTYIPYRL